jgi:hypothetical protein
MTAPISSRAFTRKIPGGNNFAVKVRVGTVDPTIDYRDFYAPAWWR